jgi:hypothetical protein
VPLPGSVSLVTVTGTLMYDDATFADTASTVEFGRTNEPWLLVPGADVIILPKLIVCTVNASGQLVGPTGAQGAGGLGVKLPATDDADVSPIGFTYTVTYRISGLEPVTYSYALPSSPSTVDLSDLTPVLPVDPTFVPMTQAQGDARYDRRYAPVTLTDASTIATDAALGDLYRVTLGGNRTLGVPTNPADGQKILYEVTQDGTGSRTLTLSTSTGGFSFGTDVPSVTLSTAAGKTDLIGAIYNLAANRWRVIAFAKGY